MADSPRQRWLPVWLFAVYATYPVPHTVALLNILLVLGTGMCLWVIYRDPRAHDALPLLKASFRPGGWILAILTGWLLIQSTLISPYPKLALDLWRHDWLNGLLVAAAGAAAVLACRATDLNRPLVAITFSLFAHLILLLGYQAWQWFHGAWDPLNNTPFAQKDYHSMLVTTLIALLLADLLARVPAREQVIPHAFLPLPAVLLMLAVSLVSTATLMARNAVIITIIMLIVSIGIFAFRGAKGLGKRALPAVIVLVLGASAVSWMALRSDARWQSFSAAAAVAFDTSDNLAWLDSEKHPRPLMQDGQPVDHSAYMRLAWGKVALEQIQRYPLGLGYGHKAFGWAVNRSYNVQSGLESSHSGLLDFTLANGIPGLLLWLALSGALMASGWRAFRKTGSPYGLMLVFTVAAYLLRCLLDGHLSGFRLEMYALLVGVLVMAQSLESGRCK